MNAERGFLQAIAESPEDDGLRLIFADWLQDHGKPTWAGVIRRQIAARPADPDGLHLPWSLSPSRFAFFQSDTDSDQLQAEMAYPLALTKAVVRRGLVDHVRVPVENLAEVVADLVAWGPVPMVQPVGVADHLADWAAPPEFTRLDLTGTGLTDAHLLALARARLFRHLETLCVTQGQLYESDILNRLTADAAGILANRAKLPALRRLALDAVPLGDDGLLELSRSPTLRGLTWLLVAACRLTGSAFGPLQREAPWPDLRTLNLSGNNLDRAGAALLADWPQLGSLRRLNLNFSKLDDAVALILGRSTHPVRLRELSLAGNELTDAGVAALLESEALAGLRVLNLPGERALGGEVRPRLAAVLAHAPCAARLERLSLRDQPLGDAGVLALVRYPRLRSLTLGTCGLGLAGLRALHDWAIAGRVNVEVAHHGLGAEAVGDIVRLQCHLLPPERQVWCDLERMHLFDVGLQRLLALPELARCSELDLMDNGLSGAGVARLAACPAIANLTRLNLGSNPIGDTGAAALANAPYLARLATLELGRCDLTDAGVVALAASPYLAAIEELVLFANALTDVAGDALARWPSAALREVHLDRSKYSAATWAALTERFGDGLKAY